MSRKQHFLGKNSVLATALALVTSGIAIADGTDNSMSRLGGEGYAYFNQPVAGNTVASAAWRRSNPGGLTERDLQALSSSALAASASRLDNLNPVFASAPADPSWRLTHPNGLTEREMQAAGSSTLAIWQVPNGSTQSNVAQSPSTKTPMSQSDTRVVTSPPRWASAE
jgi:hypothetical protein